MHISLINWTVTGLTGRGIAPLTAVIAVNDPYNNNMSICLPNELKAKRETETSNCYSALDILWLFPRGIDAVFNGNYNEPSCFNYASQKWAVVLVTPRHLQLNAPSTWRAYAA